LAKARLKAEVAEAGWGAIEPNALANLLPLLNQTGQEFELLAALEHQQVAHKSDKLSRRPVVRHIATNIAVVGAAERLLFAPHARRCCVVGEGVKIVDCFIW